MKRITGSFAENLLKTAAILLLFTAAAFMLDTLKLRVENILIIFVLGILIVVVVTKSYGWGILASVFCSLAFNYFFTDPKYTLSMEDPSYYISLAIFLISAFIVDTLTSRLQKQIEKSTRNERMIGKLYEVSRGYMNVTTIDGIIAYAEQSISTLLGMPASMYYGAAASSAGSDIAWSYTHGLPCGMGENFATAMRARCIPVMKNNTAVGVLKVNCDTQDISDDAWPYIETSINQFLIAIERTELQLAEERHRIEIEKERLRSGILKSLSHDLKTPLTSIAGGAQFLLEHVQSADRETVASLLSDINSDALWLGAMVENLLSMARIQEGKLIIKKQLEVVDDIVSEALARIRKNMGAHRFSFKPLERVVLAPMDGQLIIQVLINLLSNAIEHSRPDSDILLGISLKEERIEFTVSDDGGGLSPYALAHLFESFSGAEREGGETRKGAGLGLSICRAIVQAHGGTIAGFNNDSGGATFAFALPMGSEDENA